LWPETVEALRAVQAERPEPASDEVKGLVFVTKYGLTWARYTGDNPLSKEMKKLMNALGLNGNRNFYALRHTFETIGGESKDQVAVDHIMGHTRDDMASVYRERISDERLRTVSDHVRKWTWQNGWGKGTADPIMNILSLNPGSIVRPPPGKVKEATRSAPDQHGSGSMTTSPALVGIGWAAVSPSFMRET
jgi:hypothetical protein